MSRKPNSDQRRAEIVSALLATMAEHGYEKSTIQLIAGKAGLAPGLVHYHFKTKAEILLALVTRLAEASRQRYVDFAARAEGPDGRLRAYIDSRLALGEGADPHAVAAWVMIGSEALRQPEVGQIYRQAVEDEMLLLEGLMGECMAARGKQGRDMRPLAAALLAMVEGAFQLACAAPQVIPSGCAASTALDMVRGYIDAQ